MKERKRISVYYLHGYSNMRILRFLVIPLLLQSLLLSCMIQVLLILIFEQLEMNDHFAYSITFLPYIIILVIIVLIELLFYSMILQFSSFSKNLKMNSVLTLLPLVNEMLSNAQYTFSYLTQINHYSELEEYYLYDGVNWNFQDGFYEIALSSFHYVNEHGGFYHMIVFMQTDKGIATAYTTINHNYASYLFDVNLDPTKEYIIYKRNTKNNTYNFK